MQQYTSEFKKSMVAKVCSPRGPSVYQLAKETGISQGSLYNWVQAFGKSNQLVKKNRRPEDWTPEERLQAVFDTQKLSEQELGEFLRKKGLHSNHIKEWRAEALSDASEKRKVGRPRKDPELVKLQEENKLLKRDLRRKEKALAEQTALVILQKKVQELWGTDDEDDE